MASRLKIVVLACVLSLVVFLGEVKPVFAKKGKGTRQRVKALEKSVSELEQKMNKQDETIKELKEEINEQDARMSEQEERIKTLEECDACSKIKELNKTLYEWIEEMPKPTFKNCDELYKSGKQVDGVYSINPDGSGAFDVFCDQTTAGGGWTVFQKRLDGTVDFYRGWEEYKLGFGKLAGEFWLGLDKINRLTSSGKYKLRVDLADFEGNTAYAEYDLVTVGGVAVKYQLSVGDYSGTAGDSLTYHNGSSFTTKDQDNDLRSTSNCAVNCYGAWWYNNCNLSNLNGFYYHGEYSETRQFDGITWYGGVIWESWKGYKYSVRRAEMKIRPVDF